MKDESMDPIAAAWNWTKSVQLEDGTKLHILRLVPGVLAEVTIARLYLGMAEAKLLQVVFPGVEVPSLSWWINLVNQKRADGGPLNVILACFVQRGTDLQIVGFGSIAMITPLGMIDGEPRYKSEIGFGFLPSVHRTKLPMEFGEMMLDYCFESLRNEVVYGTTPSPNVLACRYAQRVGLKVVGILPLYGAWMKGDGTAVPCDCQVAALTRVEWESGAANRKQELVEA